MSTNSHVTKLKAQLDQAIIQREHWKQLAENRNSIVVTEVCPESRSVEEYIIDADSVRASWRLIRRYREQIEALRAENGQLSQQLAQSDAALRESRANDMANVRTLEDMWERHDALRQELESARAELAAIKGQQPVAFYWQDVGYPEPRKHGPYFGWPSESALRNVDGCAITVPLYALPPATLSPEVQASGPYASVADALAQRYPKPSLLKDCNVTYSNSSRPLAEQGERQEVWARQCDLDESDPALFVSRERVEESGYTVRLTTAPQPGPDVRALAASLYQACGAYDMPERILDVLSAAANGEPFTHMIDGLLPCVPPSDQEVRALVEALENCAAALAWNCFGECRAVHAGPIMPAAMALDTARAALSTHRQAQRQGESHDT